MCFFQFLCHPRGEGWGYWKKGGKISRGIKTNATNKEVTAFQYLSTRATEKDMIRGNWKEKCHTPKMFTQLKVV